MSGGTWLFSVLLLALLLLPLPFGGVYQWTWAGLALMVALLLLVSTLSADLKGATLPDPVRALWLPALLYLGVGVWLAVQASGLTPDAWSHPIWEQTAEVLGEPLSKPISLDPYGTWSELAKMLTFAGVFWLAVVFGRDGRRARAGLWVLGVAGSLYAIYGLAAHFTELGETLWRIDMPLAGVGVSSTFVNRTMYVDYAAFGFLAVFALILDGWQARQVANESALLRWKSLLAGDHSHLLLLVLMSLVILVALTLTGSRGGVLAVAVASAALFLLAARGKGSKGRSGKDFLLIGLILAGVWVLVFVVAGAPVGSRASTATGAWSGRLEGYRLILRAIAEAPLTGYGGGTSYDVYYLFNDGTFWQALNYAHNIYLGAAVELGVPVAVALFAAVGLVVVHCFKGVHRRRSNLAFPALGIAVGVHVAIHGIVDSPLYLSANAATFSFLLGLAYTQSWPSRRP